MDGSSAVSVTLGFLMIGDWWWQWYLMYVCVHVCVLCGSVCDSVSVVALDTHHHHGYHHHLFSRWPSHSFDSLIHSTWCWYRSHPSAFHDPWCM